jgi:hypothetical protein
MKVGALFSELGPIEIVVLLQFLECHCYNFVHENVGNPTLNIRPTIFFVNFHYSRDGLAKNLISNIYCQDIRLWINYIHLMHREILSQTQNKSEEMPLK